MTDSLYFIHAEYIESSVLESILKKNVAKLELKINENKHNSLKVWVPDSENLEFEFLDKKTFTKTLGDWLESYGTVFYIHIYSKEEEGSKLFISIIKEFLAEYPNLLVVSPDAVPIGVRWYIYSKEDFDSFDPNEPFGYLSPPPINPAHIVKKK